MKKLGFGMMRLPLTDPGDQSKIDDARTARMIDDFIDGGFRYFDTAYMYHTPSVSEETIGRLLSARRARDEFELTDKMPISMVSEPGDFERIIAGQMARCRVDRFDRYLLHNLGSTNYAKVQRLGGFEFLKRLKADGRAGRIGFSWHDQADALDRVLTEHPETEMVLLQINYADWEDEGIQSRRNYEACVAHGVDVAVMEPLKGGALARLPEAAYRILADVSPHASAASWGLRFAASLRGVFVVLSGMSTEDQLRENMALFDALEPLSDGERDALARAAEAVRGAAEIQCTACRYCTDDCPKRIPIPDIFALFNDQKRFGKMPTHIDTYGNVTTDRGRAADCVACGRCEAHCPQHLPIIDSLKLASAVYDC